MFSSLEDKLELFQQAILQKAQSQRDEILRETEEAKTAELGSEENRLLERLYDEMQAQINEIRQECVKEISRETTAYKRRLFQQREQYLIELIAQARANLTEFVQSDGYEAFLLRKVTSFAEQGMLEGGVVLVRKEDLRFTDKIKAICPACDVQTEEDAIAIGGAILINRTQGIEIDHSLDAALAEQREWFHNHATFHFE